MLSFTNIWGLRSNFVDSKSFPWIKISWNSCYVWNKLGWLNWFCQFLCERLSSFNPKGFRYWYTWPRSLCEGRTSFSTGRISRKLCRFLLMFSTGFTSLSVLLLFPLSIIFFIFLHSFLVLFHLTLMRLSWSTHLLMFFPFGDFNVHHKDWFTYSGPTDRYFSISNGLTHMVNFPTQIPDCDSHSPPLLDLFFSSDSSICSTMAFTPLGSSDHVVVLVFIDFRSNS